MTKTTILGRFFSPTSAALVVTTLVAVALLALSAPTLARPHGPGGFGPGGPGGGLFGGPMFERVAERLELTAEQQEQIRGVFEEYRPQLEGSRDLMRNARTVLHDQIHAELFDEGAIRQAAADLAELEADLAVTRALIAQEVRQVLTPEQQVEAKQMMEDARAWREAAGERFRGRRGGRGPDPEDSE